MQRCAGCGEESPDPFRVCGYCGTPLTGAAPAPSAASLVSCPACGEQNPAKFRMCGFCGASLTAAGAVPAPPPTPDPPVEETRRTVSIVFSDLQGSTDLGERLDSEALREVLGVYFDRMRSVLQRHGGTVEKYIGDAIMAVFGLPTVHEDDALRAVRAAHEMCAALDRLNDELEQGWGVRLVARTGVNTGEVIAGDAATAQRLVTGDPVNVAARLEQAAPPLEVLIGETTHRLVRDAVEVEPLEPLTLKGKSEPVPAYRLLRVASRPVTHQRFETPMVGRESEFAALTGAYTRAAQARRCGLVRLNATAGTGKSRLLQEFATVASVEAQVLTGRCPSYGDSITFWPVAEIVRAAAGIGPDEDRTQALARLGALVPDERASDALAAVLGLTESERPLEQIFWAVAELLRTLAAARPVIAVLEDVHWAAPTLLDLLEYVVRTLGDVPVLVVTTSRPDFDDANADWLADHPAVHRVDLTPLTDADSERLVRCVLGDSALLDQVVRRIVDAGSGNPLFIEQMLAMLVDDGSLAQDAEGRWRPTGRLDTVSVPSSVAALISARLERLPPTERSVLQRAAVMGQVFYPDALRDCAPAALHDSVAPAVTSLARRGLVRAEESYLSGHDAFRLHHALIRDVAYNEVLKRTRADLHESLAGWLEREAGTRAREYEEITGYHLERAYRTRCELGPPDERVLALGHRAGERLGAAGERALGRGDMPGAANLLGRATGVLAPDAPERTRLLPDHAEALAALGEFDDAAHVLDDADRAATATGDGSLSARAAVERQLVGWLTGTLSYDAIVAGCEVAAARLDPDRDARHLAKASRLAALVHLAAFRYGDADRAAALALRYAEASGDRRLLLRVSSTYVQSSVDGAAPVAEALVRCEQTAAQAPEDRRLQALVADLRARLLAMQGDFAEARAAYRRSHALLDELGERPLRALGTDCAGEVELLAGDPAAAERELRHGFELLSELGSLPYLSTIAARLGDAVLAQGRPEEAETLTRVSEQAADDDDVFTDVLWHTVRARADARLGRPDEARSGVTEAVRVARTADSPTLLATALLATADVSARIGEPFAAASAAHEAGRLLASKGHLVGVAAAGRLLTELAGSRSVIDLRETGPTGGGQRTLDLDDLQVATRADRAGARDGGAVPGR